MARELKDQIKWKDIGLLDLRSLDVASRLKCPKELSAGINFDDAFSIICHAFGCYDVDKAMINSVLGPLTVERDCLKHIVEKRQDARERYANYAILTLEKPFEVWSVEYDDGSSRYAFIGAFRAKRQMLVIVTIEPDKLLWNFMHCDSKSLNKHRHGNLIYQSSLHIKKAAK